MVHQINYSLQFTVLLLSSLLHLNYPELDKCSSILFAFLGCECQKENPWHQFKPQQLKINKKKYHRDIFLLLWLKLVYKNIAY